MKLESVFLVCMLTTVLSAVVVYEQKKEEEPSFCHKLECPKFQTVKTFKTYELRSYEPSVWVATNLTTAIFTDEDRRRLFMTLFYYISGNNSQHTKIPMTAPVLETIKHGQGPDCDSIFTSHFMMPFELQSNPPAPTDPKVFIARLPAISVYVSISITVSERTVPIIITSRSFGGYTNGTKIQENISQLAEDIGDASKYTSNPYYSASYDSPYQVLNRHNEVWLQATGK